MRFHSQEFTQEDHKGHPYHSLAYGDQDGPEDSVLFVDFFRMDPLVYGDEYGVAFKLLGHQVIVPESILKMVLSEGWNYKSNPQKFDCDQKHELINPDETA